VICIHASDCVLLTGFVRICDQLLLQFSGPVEDDRDWGIREGRVDREEKAFAVAGDGVTGGATNIAGDLK
jgi:hypothetical protein